MPSDTRPAGSASAPKIRREFRILCVDDEPPIRDIMQMLLRRRGYVVDVAPDGLAAWELLSDSAGVYDLVVTDNEMPRLGGMALVQLLRQARFAGKIIVFSSSLDVCDVEKLRRWTVDGIVEKGGSAQRLLEAVDAALATIAPT